MRGSSVGVEGCRAGTRTAWVLARLVGVDRGNLTPGQRRRSRTPHGFSAHVLGQPWPASWPWGLRRARLGPPVMSSRAVVISPGRLMSAVASSSASCLRWRGPTRAHATVGASRTQHSATWAGVMPNPSPALATASTTARGFCARYGSTNHESSCDAARESPGVPVR